MGWGARGKSLTEIKESLTEIKRKFRSLAAFCKKFFWFIEIKEGGGSFYIEGGGVQVIRRIKKRGWGRLTCFGFALTPGGPYVLLNN